MLRRNIVLIMHAQAFPSGLALMRTSVPLDVVLTADSQTTASAKGAPTTTLITRGTRQKTLSKNEERILQFCLARLFITGPLRGI